MDQQEEKTVVSIVEKINDDFVSNLNDQDTKQKISMYMAFIMEFYRVLMGSFLILFVPQKCNDEICGLFENVATGKPIVDTAFSMNVILFTLYFLKILNNTVNKSGLS